MLRAFINLNKDICTWIEQYLPQLKVRIYEIIPEIVAPIMNARPDQLIVDMGGGRSCPFADLRTDDSNTKIVCMDISEAEIRHNVDVDVRIVADAVDELPFRDESVDIVVTRFLIEHLKNTEEFIVHSGRILKKGGYAIHLFPCKFSPFALINTMLPARVSKGLLHGFYPWTKNIMGFKSYYDKCYYSAIKRMLEKHGFQLEQAHFGYAQASYFFFFAPLFVCVALFDMILYFANAKNLCANLALVARKL